MKCTIIIPTYNRPDYLKRLLSYYDSYNIECKIIIADSSSEDNKIENERISSHFSNLNILHVADYPDTISPKNKFCDILNYVNSEYALFCADDDFITPNGIRLSIDFLDDNSDYSVAHGVSFSFKIKQKTGNMCKSIWNTRDLPISVTSSDSKSRIYHYMKYFSSNPIFYSVYRTDFLKIIFEETIKYTDDWLLGEQLLIFLVLIHGKSKCLDIPYCARNTSLDSHGTPSMHGHVNDEAIEEKLTKFKICLTNHLKETSNNDIGDFNEMIDKWMYARISKRKQNQSILFRKINVLFDDLELPNWIDKKIRFVYRKLFPLNVPVDFPVYIDNPRYQDDLNKIRKYVENRY